MSSSTPARGTRARAERLGGSPVAKAATPPAGAKTAPAGGSGGSGPASRSGARPTSASPPVGPEVVERELGPDELAALEEQREFLLTSLRDLEAEHDVGDVDEGDYDQLKDDYTARAAAVIRAIDSHHRLVASRSPRMSWSRRLLVLGAVAVVALLAGVLVARSAGQRDAGDTITGGVRQSTRDDLLAARQKFGNKDYDSAIAIYDSVLTDDPANVEALTYRGWMHRLKATQQTSSDPVPSLKSAVADLKAALAVAPTDGTALTFLAVLYGDIGCPSQAVATLAQVPADGVPSFMAGMVDTFRQKMQAEISSGVPDACAPTPTTTG
ncbi:MAG: tetratricopeptide repeat protein [Acidimicrobiales bacterium]